MRQRGWLTAEWRQTPNNQRARYYTITAAGRKRLGEQTTGFTELMTAIQRVMRTEALLIPMPSDRITQSANPE